MIDFLIKFVLPIVATIASFFAFGVKKYIEKTAELMAEERYRKGIIK